VATSFRLLQKSVTLNDPERRNGRLVGVIAIILRYFAESVRCEIKLHESCQS